MLCTCLAAIVVGVEIVKPSKMYMLPVLESSILSASGWTLPLLYAAMWNFQDVYPNISSTKIVHPSILKVFVLLIPSHLAILPCYPHHPPCRLGIQCRFGQLCADHPCWESSINHPCSLFLICLYCNQGVMHAWWIYILLWPCCPSVKR